MIPIDSNTRIDNPIKSNSIFEMDLVSDDRIDETIAKNKEAHKMDLVNDDDIDGIIAKHKESHKNFKIEFRSSATFSKEIEIIKDDSTNSVYQNHNPDLFNLILALVVNSLQFGMLIKLQDDTNYYNKSTYCFFQNDPIFYCIVLPFTSLYVGYQSSDFISDSSMMLLSSLSTNICMYFKIDNNVVRSVITMLCIPLVPFHIISLNPKILIGRLLLLGLFIVEMVMAVLMIITALRVMWVQQSVLDMVVNFSGVLIVADFDNFVANHLKPKTNLLIINSPKFDQYKIVKLNKSLTKRLIEVLMISFSVIFAIILYQQGVMWNPIYCDTEPPN